MTDRWRRRWSVPALLTVLAVVSTWFTLSFATWHFLPCSNGHPGPDVLWRNGCYSDVLPLYGGRHLDTGAWPYVEADVEYPVLIGAVMALVGLPVHALDEAGRLLPVAQRLGFETVDQGVVFFWGTAALLSVLAMACTLLMLQLREHRRSDVLLWAFSPVLGFEAFVNWDLVAVPLCLGALLAWKRGRPGWAGALAGLGAAAKIYPGLLVVPLLLLCLRARRAGVRPALSLVSGAAGAWTLVNLPVALAAPWGWYHPYDFSAKRWIDWGSLWFLLDHLPQGLPGVRGMHPWWADVPSLNRSTVIAFGICLLALGVLTLAAPEPPRVAQLAFLVVAAFLLTNKVWSPQFALWLVPLAVLARPRPPALLAWQLVDVVYFFDVMRTVLGQRDDYAFVQFSAARWLAVAFLVAAVVTDVLRPRGDVVRLPDGSDPDDGVLRPALARAEVSPGAGDADAEPPADLGQGAQEQPDGSGPAVPAVP